MSALRLLIGATLVVAVASVPAARGQQIILAEDFNDGVIHAETWCQYGAPASYVYTTDPPAIGGGSLDNNGDNNCASGIVSQQTFALVPNLSIRFRSYLHANGTGTQNPNQHNDVWMTDASCSAFGECQSEQGIGPGIRHHGGGGGGGDDVGKTNYFNGKTMIDNENRFPAAFEEWVAFEIRTLADGSVQFYRNGVHIQSADSDPGFLDYGPQTQVRLVLSGKTYNTVLLLDNVSVTNLHPIPTVSEWGLVVMVLLMLGAGAAVLVRRRAVTDG